MEDTNYEKLFQKLKSKPMRIEDSTDMILIHEQRITETTAEKYRKWLKEQNEIAIERQKLSISEDSLFYSYYKQAWDLGYPYTGAVGALLTYSITPTSIGTLISVTNSLTKETIDLNDDI